MGNCAPYTTRTEASSPPQSGLGYREPDVWRRRTLVADNSSAATALQPRFRQASLERGISPPERRPSLTARTQSNQQQQFIGRPPPPPPPQPVNRRNSSNDKRSQLTKKYAYIPDNYTSLEQVTAALREAGLESSNLIVGIDFTKSNEWTGKHSFRGQSLHKLGDQPNPYEQAITIIGKVLAPFDDDNLIPCFGFGDMTTHDTHVFSFHPDNSPCHGFEEVLSCYKKIVPHLRLAGPTSFAPIVEAAVDIVERNHGQYHVLLIIADGQVTRSVDTDDGELSPQEKKTIDSIVMASAYPLSIVLVGVGDGPWDDMKKFDDKLPARDFDNFQFVNFTAIMGRNASAAEKEAAFALAALMEVPLQYKATMELGILGQVTGKAKRVVPRPPPLPAAQTQRSYVPQQSRRPERSSTLQRSSSSPAQSSNDDQSQTCPVCLTNAKDLAFGCGHMCCRDCAESLIRCPICRTIITSRLRVYTG
ncbi:E3 ubiquitin-protein ligase RGLG4-like isoform X2 [Zingiber officinale]|uniref:E3 ubiquitin-protein ligase RGLG4-like isoform X2 n=1 Tax=Zingiber officinale TaxID=94328 RepID=UPI001C4CAE23|nr:E3 ubiquitin-protein ligase RGLG4-like isoform X2 [Zingiber officinale]